MNDTPKPPSDSPPPAAPTASPAAPGPQTAAGAAPRFDRAFIEDNRLLERYLDGKLPFKGARDLERWCAEHPEYLEELNLAGRTQASLKLLDASGRPPDLGEPRPPWWRTPWFSIGSGLVVLACLIGFSALLGENTLLRGRVADAQARLAQGSMLPPTSELALSISPDHAPGIDRARFAVNHKATTLVNLKIDMSYVRVERFRVSVDKRDQGRVLVLDGLAKDSNGELRVSFNSTALAPGRYDIRIEALPLLGAPIADGWLIMNVQ